jgi:CheY-like chemotaxis protein
MHLEQAELQVIEASSGRQAIQYLQEYAIELVILDLMMDDGNGFEVLQYLRESNAESLVIALSARREVQDKILTLGLGADDYVTKPFSPNPRRTRLITFTPYVESVTDSRETNNEKSNKHWLLMLIGAIISVLLFGLLTQVMSAIGDKGYSLTSLNAISQEILGTIAKQQAFHDADITQILDVAHINYPDIRLRKMD